MAPPCILPCLHGKTRRLSFSPEAGKSTTPLSISSAFVLHGAPPPSFQHSPSKNLALRFGSSFLLPKSAGGGGDIGIRSLSSVKPCARATDRDRTIDGHGHSSSLGGEKHDEERGRERRERKRERERESERRAISRAAECFLTQNREKWRRRRARAPRTPPTFGLTCCGGGLYSLLSHRAKSADSHVVSLSLAILLMAV